MYNFALVTYESILCVSVLRTYSRTVSFRPCRKYVASCSRGRFNLAPMDRMSDRNESIDSLGCKRRFINLASITIAGSLLINWASNACLKAAQLPVVAAGSDESHTTALSERL